MNPSKAWIVGVEDIRPHGLRSAPIGVCGTVVWHSSSTRRLHTGPHRTLRQGKDELDLYMGFLRALKAAGYVAMEGEDAQG